MGGPVPVVAVLSVRLVIRYGHFHKLRARPRQVLWGSGNSGAGSSAATPADHRGAAAGPENVNPDLRRRDAVEHASRLVRVADNRQLRAVSRAPGDQVAHPRPR